MHRYTPEQIEYIRSIASGQTVADIQLAFNAKYKTDVSCKSISGIMHRHNIKNNMQGYNTRFKKGQKSWSKGMKGLQLGGEETWFKKGDPSRNKKPIGTESIHEGIWWVKTGEPDIWTKKHRHIWEKSNGPIPEDKVLRFKDGDRTNCTLDNLFMTTRKALISVVKSKREQVNPELNVTAHRIAELEMKIKDLAAK